MAKVLDALEQARRERLRVLRESGAPVDEPSDRPGLEVQSGPKELARRDSSLTPANRPVLAPATHHRVARELFGIHDPGSPVAEQVRQIRANLETVLANVHSRLLVVTSPVAGDGKTLVAANLATILADDPRIRVVLVDGDLRKPDQHRLFGLKGSPGLAEYLRGRCELAEVAVGTTIPNLDVIPAGFPPEKPTVLFSSEKMAELASALEQRYQWILFDTPPMLPVSDASVLGRLATGLILVVRVGQTTRNAIERAQEILGETKLPVLGCILNDYNERTSQNDYYYKSYGRADRYAADRAG